MYELTQYEALDLARSVLNAIQNDIQLAFAVFTAYLVCAYSAGAKLTTFQVSVVNTGFLAFQGYALFGFFGDFDVVKGLWVHAGVIPVESRNEMSLFEMIVAVFGVGAILASLSFMWSVRHPKTAAGNGD